jgi:hypothetical protein
MEEWGDIGFSVGAKQVPCEESLVRKCTPERCRVSTRKFKPEFRRCCLASVTAEVWTPVEVDLGSKLYTGNHSVRTTETKGGITQARVKVESGNFRRVTIGALKHGWKRAQNAVSCVRV